MIGNSIFISWHKWSLKESINVFIACQLFTLSSLLMRNIVYRYGLCLTRWSNSIHENHWQETLRSGGPFPRSWRSEFLCLTFDFTCFRVLHMYRVLHLGVFKTCPGRQNGATKVPAHPNRGHSNYCYAPFCPLDGTLMVVKEVMNPKMSVIWRDMSLQKCAALSMSILLV